MLIGLLEELILKPIDLRLFVMYNIYAEGREFAGVLILRAVGTRLPLQQVDTETGGSLF